MFVESVEFRVVHDGLRFVLRLDILAATKLLCGYKPELCFQTPIDW